VRLPVQLQRAMAAEAEAAREARAKVIAAIAIPIDICFVKTVLYDIMIFLWEILCVLT